jgi:hypothetical protein
MKKYQIFVLSMILITTSQLSFTGQEQQRPVPARPIMRRQYNTVLPYNVDPYLNRENLEAGLVLDIYESTCIYDEHINYRRIRYAMLDQLRNTRGQIN